MKEYTDDELEQAFFEAEMEGVVTCTCRVCGEVIQAEPDARRSYCYNCQSVKPLDNPYLVLLTL